VSCSTRDTDWLPTTIYMRELGLRSVSESESESFKFAIGRSWIGIGLEPRQPECGFADMGSCKVETGVFVAVLRWLSRTLRLNGRLHRKQGGYVQRGSKRSVYNCSTVDLLLV
jgi:hypothetical protein